MSEYGYNGNADFADFADDADSNAVECLPERPFPKRHGSWRSGSASAEAAIRHFPTVSFK